MLKLQDARGHVATAREEGVPQALITSRRRQPSSAWAGVFALIIMLNCVGVCMPNTRACACVRNMLRQRTGMYCLADTTHTQPYTTQCIYESA
eukprot:5106592-Alexandrium_andersonii.AAC.1